MEIAYIGTTENVAAEYGVACDLPFCIALFYGGEPVSIEGALTKEHCLKLAKEYDCAKEFLFS